LTYLYIIISLLLIAIAFEDIRYKAVHALLFPALFAAAIALRSIETGFRDLAADFFCNLLLIFFNLVLVTLYFSVKQGKPVNITKGMLSWGDIIFFTCCAALIPFRWFCIFLPVSLVFSLLLWFIIMAFSAKKDRQVPLAGLQAVFVLCCLVLNLVYGTSVLPGMFDPSLFN
jgi:hypothetical protein